MTNTDIISGCTPKLIAIPGIARPQQAMRASNLLVYGEIHGIRENADVIYTLVHELRIKQIAIENSPSIKDFIDLASRGIYDFSRIDPDTFDLSILSLEVAKTIATLLKEGVIDTVAYIDTFFDSPDRLALDHPDSPQTREQVLAENILGLDTAYRTLCLMGQWHTQPEPIQSDGILHTSALCRIRRVRQDALCAHMIYRAGRAYNCGHVLDLPERSDVSHRYEVRPRSSLDFDIHVPYARPTVLDEPNTSTDYR
ncbi:MAG: hypothetical protein CSA83_01470 [Actinomycetales bacterium]|nr:MAG: hypothetical protein CSA83_01470 [Actinomycetales bacterium]